MTKLFVVGDEHNYDTTFLNLASLPDVEKITYSQAIFSSRTIASCVPVQLCFPYSLWDNMVEVSDRLYGVGEFGDAIRKLANMVTEELEKKFPGAQYVNPPMSILSERDKLNAKKKVAEAGLKVPLSVNKIVDAVLKETEVGNYVYIKPRYGSMGKGITCVGPKKWTTNFSYDGQRIMNHRDDRSWKEIDITGDRTFLERILEEDVVVERGVKNSSTNGLRFDLRAHAVFGDVDLEFSYGRVTSTSYITNISQGGISTPFLDMKKLVPKGKLYEALDLIKKAANIFGFRYAGGDVLFEGEDYNPVFLEINSFPSPDTLPTPRHTERLLRSLYNSVLSIDAKLKAVG